MSLIRFEWDEAKNAANQRKHGVSFEEASRVFFDPLLLIVQDRIVDGEERWQALGVVQEARTTALVLVVAHTVREELDEIGEIEVVRIVSARKATSQERRIYEEENG